MRRTEARLLEWLSNGANLISEMEVEASISNNEMMKIFNQNLEKALISLSDSELLKSLSYSFPSNTRSASYNFESMMIITDILNNLTEFDSGSVYLPIEIFKHQPELIISTIEDYMDESKFIDLRSKSRIQIQSFELNSADNLICIDFEKFGGALESMLNFQLYQN